MNVPGKSLLAMVLMVSASSVWAGDSANLKVTGTIQPAGCSISLSGGDIDYGAITLAESGETTLVDKTVTYVVDCGAAGAKMSLSWADSRPTAGSGVNFGLRAIEGGVELGSYTIQQKKSASSIDGAQSHLMMKSAAGGWSPITGEWVPINNNGDEITHSLTNSAPDAGRIFKGEYQVTSTLKEGIAGSGALTLDGLATVTVMML